MRKRPELPPELADAIEFTDEYRHAMGLPSAEELARIPEWYAVNAMITADEYLACFGYTPQTFTPISHGLRGRPKSSRRKLK